MFDCLIDVALGFLSVMVVASIINMHRSGGSPSAIIVFIVFVTALIFMFLAKENIVNNVATQYTTIQQVQNAHHTEQYFQNLMIT